MEAVVNIVMPMRAAAVAIFMCELRVTR
jgi:hypothetical protein